MIFVRIICFEFPRVAAAQIPKPHTPSGKKSVPAKVQFEHLLYRTHPLLISTLCRVISIETQNCFFCEEQALFFSTIDLCRYLLLRRRGCDFCKMCFSHPSFCRFHRPFFCDCHSSILEFVSQILDLFPILILKFRFRIDGLSFQ